jgi:plastocyanin
VIHPGMASEVPERMKTARDITKPRPAIVVVALLVALGVSGCGGDDDASSPKRSAAPAGRPARSAATVTISSFKFRPGAVTVKAGGTVTFVNRDKAPHTAQTELNPRTAEFDTKRLERGGRKVVKLPEPGRFEYFCAFHRFMEGEVKVVE